MSDTPSSTGLNAELEALLWDQDEITKRTVATAEARVLAAIAKAVPDHREVGVASYARIDKLLTGVRERIAKMGEAVKDVFSKPADLTPEKVAARIEQASAAMQADVAKLCKNGVDDGALRLMHHAIAEAIGSPLTAHDLTDDAMYHALENVPTGKDDIIAHAFFSTKEEEKEKADNKKDKGATVASGKTEGRKAEKKEVPKLKTEWSDEELLGSRPLSGARVSTLSPEMRKARWEDTVHAIVLDIRLGIVSYPANAGDDLAEMQATIRKAKPIAIQAIEKNLREYDMFNANDSIAIGEEFFRKLPDHIAKEINQLMAQSAKAVNPHMTNYGMEEDQAKTVRTHVQGFVDYLLERSKAVEYGPFARFAGPDDASLLLVTGSAPQRTEYGEVDGSSGWQADLRRYIEEEGVVLDANARFWMHKLREHIDRAGTKQHAKYFGKIFTVADLERHLEEAVRALAEWKAEDCPPDIARRMLNAALRDNLSLLRKRFVEHLYAHRTSGVELPKEEETALETILSKPVSIAHLFDASGKLLPSSSQEKKETGPSIERAEIERMVDDMFVRLAETPVGKRDKLALMALRSKTKEHVATLKSTVTSYAQVADALWPTVKLITSMTWLDKTQRTSNGMVVVMRPHIADRFHKELCVLQASLQMRFNEKVIGRTQFSREMAATTPVIEGNLATFSARFDFDQPKIATAMSEYSDNKLELGESLPLAIDVRTMKLLLNDSHAMLEKVAALSAIAANPGQFSATWEKVRTDQNSLPDEVFGDARTVSEEELVGMKQLAEECDLKTLAQPCLLRLELEFLVQECFDRAEEDLLKLDLNKKAKKIIETLRKSTLETIGACEGVIDSYDKLRPFFKKTVDISMAAHRYANEEKDAILATIHDRLRNELTWAVTHARLHFNMRFLTVDKALEKFKELFDEHGIKHLIKSALLGLEPTHVERCMEKCTILLASSAGYDEMVIDMQGHWKNIREVMDDALSAGARKEEVEKVLHVLALIDELVKEHIRGMTGIRDVMESCTFPLNHSLLPQIESIMREATGASIDPASPEESDRYAGMCGAVFDSFEALPNAYHKTDVRVAHMLMIKNGQTSFMPTFLHCETWGEGTIERERAMSAAKAFAGKAIFELCTAGKGDQSSNERLVHETLRSCAMYFPSSATPAMYACAVRAIAERIVLEMLKARGAQHNDASVNALPNAFAIEFLRELLKEEPQETADEDPEDDEPTLTRDEALVSFLNNAPKPLNADDTLTQQWVDAIAEAIGCLPETIESYDQFKDLFRTHLGFDTELEDMDESAITKACDAMRASFGKTLSFLRKRFSIASADSALLADKHIEVNNQHQARANTELDSLLATKDFGISKMDFRTATAECGAKMDNLYRLQNSLHPHSTDRLLSLVSLEMNKQEAIKIYKRVFTMHGIPLEISEWSIRLLGEFYNSLSQYVEELLPPAPAPLSREKVSAIFDEFEPKPFDENDGFTSVWIDSTKRRISELPDRIESYADLRTLLEHHCSYPTLLFDRGMKVGADANDFDHVKKVITHATVAFNRMLDAWRKPFDVPVVTREAFLREYAVTMVRISNESLAELGRFNHPHLASMGDLMKNVSVKSKRFESLLRVGIPNTVDSEFIRAYCTECNTVERQLHNKEFTLNDVPVEVSEWFNGQILKNTDVTLKDMTKLFPEKPGELKRDAIVAQFRSIVPTERASIEKVIELWQEHMEEAIGHLPDTIGSYNELDSVIRKYVAYTIDLYEKAVFVRGYTGEDIQKIERFVGIIGKAFGGLIESWRTQFAVATSKVGELSKVKRETQASINDTMNKTVNGLPLSSAMLRDLNRELDAVNGLLNPFVDFVYRSLPDIQDKITALALHELMYSAGARQHTQVFDRLNIPAEVRQTIRDQFNQGRQRMTNAIASYFPEPAQQPAPQPAPNGKKKKPAKIVVGASTLLLETPAGTPKNSLSAAGLKTLINRVLKKITGNQEEILTWRAHARAAVDKACGKDEDATPYYAAILSGFGWAIDQATNDELKAALTMELLAWRAETEGAVQTTTKAAPDAPSGEAPSSEAPAPRSPLDATLDALEVPVEPAARARHLARTASTILCHGVESAANRRKLTPDELAAIERSMAGIVEDLEKTTYTANNREALNAAILHAARSTGSADVVAIVQETLATPELEDLLLEHHPTEHFEPTAVVEMIRTREQHVRNEEQDMRIAGELPTKQRNVAAMRKRIATVEKNLAERARNAATPQQRAEAAEQLRDLEQTLQGLLSLYPEYDAD